MVLNVSHSTAMFFAFPAPTSRSTKWWKRHSVAGYSTQNGMNKLYSTASVKQLSVDSGSAVLTHFGKYCWSPIWKRQGYRHIQEFAKGSGGSIKNIWGAWPLITWEATMAKRNLL